VAAGAADDDAMMPGQLYGRQCMAYALVPADRGLTGQLEDVVPELTAGLPVHEEECLCGLVRAAARLPRLSRETVHRSPVYYVAC